LRHVSEAFIEEINKLTHNLRHVSGALQTVPTFYLFLQRTLQTPASNCAYILFISSMNAPDTCRKLCVNLFISSMNVPDTCLKLCLHFIYFLHERPRHMPQIVRQFIYFLNQSFRLNLLIEEINKM
jgi:hypothetical protein